MSKYNVDEIRRKLKESQAGKFVDPDQFKPDKAKSPTEPIKYRFFILPPIIKGDELKSGVVKKSMDQFFISHANHWINDRPHPCPRVWSNDTCEICEFGFSLLREDENKKDEDKRRKIIKQWMPTTYYAVNIFFTNWKGNPEHLRNKIRWFDAPKTCFDQWTATLMKDDLGDPEDPEAYGVFFDENAAFVYELAVLRQGRQNSYKTSRFLPNGGKKVPMIKNADGSPNEAGLAKLLRLRHNLWDKINEPDPAKIHSIFMSMAHGDDVGDNDQGGFDRDDTVNDDAVKEEKRPASSKQQQDDDGDAPMDEAIDDSLADEAPLDDDETPQPSRKETPQKEASQRKASNTSTNIQTDDVDKDEIDELLSQLDDD